MENLYLFLMFFIIIYLLYLVTVVLNKKKLNNFLDTQQCQIIVKLGHLNTKKLNIKSLANTIALVNSFMISITTVFLVKLDMFYLLKLLIALVILIPLVLGLYKLVSLIYKKKEGK